MDKELIRDVFSDILSDIVPDSKVSCTYNSKEFDAMKLTFQVEQVFSLEGEAPEYAYSILVDMADLERLSITPKQNERIDIGSESFLILSRKPDPLGGNIRYDLGYKYA